MAVTKFVTVIVIVFEEYSDFSLSRFVLICQI